MPSKYSLFFSKSIKFPIVHTFLAFIIYLRLESTILRINNIQIHIEATLKYACLCRVAVITKFFIDSLSFHSIPHFPLGKCKYLKIDWCLYDKVSVFRFSVKIITVRFEKHRVRIVHSIAKQPICFAKISDFEVAWSVIITDVVLLKAKYYARDNPGTITISFRLLDYEISFEI